MLVGFIKSDLFSPKKISVKNNPLEKVCTPNIINVRLDSKGRISIPSLIRKNLDLNPGDSLELIFDLKKDFFIVQNSVEESIEVCGTSGEGSIPSSGPQKSKRRNLYE